MPALRSGERLGPYEIEAALGQGGMAEVYRARHVELGRPVAIKVLSPAFRADPTFPLRFRREARTVARLAHPNIVTLFDYGEHGGVAYLVMELAPGGTLEDRLGGLATLAQVVDALEPVGEALQFAHDRGVVHRDVKPANVLIGDDGRALLADFGLARVADETLDVDFDEELIEGTAHYMAPEQVTAGAIDRRADIYAFGIMAYQSLTGQLPYDGPTVEAVLEQQLGAPPPSVRVALPDAPPELDGAVRRATAKRPAERFDEMAGFVGELRRAAERAPSLPIGRRPRAPHAGSPATVEAAPAAVSAMSPEPAGYCGACGRAFLRFDRFCRNCGGARPAGAPSGDDIAAAARAEAQPPPAGATSGAAPRRRRATAFNRYHWMALIGAFVVVTAINTVGYWIAQSGRDAAENVVFESLHLYIWDHLGTFKSALTLLGLAFAVAAGLTMRVAVIDRRTLPGRAYRRLRQNHRFVGYTAAAIAYAIGFLTCLGIYGFDTSSPRATLHSLFGGALLALLAAKVAIVRWAPGGRRHLAVLGGALVALFALVFLTSAVPYMWEQVNQGFPPYRPFSDR